MYLFSEASSNERTNSMTTVMRFSFLLVCGGIMATHAPVVAPTLAQERVSCRPTRPGFETCRRRTTDGTVDIERIAAPKRLTALFIHKGVGSERLARRMLDEAFASTSAPAAARPILRNALQQCLRSGAEITTKIGPVEWLFMREGPYACVVRIGGRDDGGKVEALGISWRLR
jgi:hypothetical protein